jgi:hypothetical protein
VRKAALLACSELPPSDAAASAVLAALQEPRNAEDRWIPDAATSAAAQNDAGFLKATLQISNRPLRHRQQKHPRRQTDRESLF